MLNDQLAPAHHDATLAAVEPYIMAHLGQPLDRRHLAMLAGFSVPHFHRLFAKRTGVSVGTFIRRERLVRAGRKLRMGAVDVTEVALAAGYDSQAAFGKAFKRHFGLTPGAFRELDCHTATHLLRQG